MSAVEKAVSDERLSQLHKQLDTAPYPNDDSRDICKLLRELQLYRYESRAMKDATSPQRAGDGQ